MELPYDPNLHEGWQSEVDGWPWQQLDKRSWRKRGLCPRCKHNMTVDYTVSIIADFLPALRGGPKRRRKLARCDCNVAHPGQPIEEPKKQGLGCGQQANITAPTG